MMSKNMWRRPIAMAIVLCSIVAVVGLLPAQAQNTTNPTMVTVSGGGWGHGIGMSQYGAYGRAVNGDTHEEILDFYYPGSELTKVETFDDLRIHIHSAGGTVVTPDKDADLEIVDSKGDLIFNHRNGKPLTIKRIKGGFTVTRPNSTGRRDLCIASDKTNRCKGGEIRIRFVQGEPIKVDAINRVSVGSTGNSYQWGELIISRRPSNPKTTMYVVLGGLTLDQYIYGLAEVPASWPSETLQSQAVAGRTYGYDRAKARRANAAWTRPWDLYSTIDDQVYNGLAKEIGPFGPPWTGAVDATSGEVLLYDGKPITAFYSSSNGGWSEDSGYVFVTSLPYLVARKDTEDAYMNPFAKWSRDYTGDEVGRWLVDASVGDVGRVKNVKISGNIGASGRVDRATVTVTGTRGELVMSGNTFRNVINAGVRDAGGGLSRQVLSTKYKVTITGGSDPVGAVDKIKRRGDNVRVTGWVFDPDSDNPVDVQIRVDDVVVETITTGQSRFDIDAIFGEGTSRGYDTTIAVSSGAHQVCAYAHNIFGTGRMLLGCKAV